MAVYNLTNVSKSGDLLEIATHLNQQAPIGAGYGALGLMIFISVMLLVFINLRLRTTAATSSILVATMFVGLITSLLLAQSSLLPESAVALAFVGLIFSLAMLWMTQSQDISP